MSFPLLLFAAGLGTRMGELTKNRPKPLVHVAGKALIDHAIPLSAIPGVGKRVVNVHYKAQMVRDHLADTDVAISDETGTLLETGGGLRHALPLLGEGPVITMNSDAIWRGPNPVAQVMDSWQEHMECLMLIVPKMNVSGHLGQGDFRRNPQGRLIRGPGDIYTGVQIIRTDTLADIADTAFSMNVAWDQMASRGGLYGVTYDGQWCDVGQPSSIPLAEAMLHV